MLTANEANLIAYRVNEPERLARDKQVEADVAEILAKIKDAAENGDYALLLDLKAQPLKSDAFEVAMALKPLGFGVERTKIKAQRTILNDELLIKWDAI